MKQHWSRACTFFAVLAFAVSGSSAWGANWSQFRGPGGLGQTTEKGLPLKWSATENIVWRTELPGPGTSSPIVVGDRVYLTSYTGYGLEPSQGDLTVRKTTRPCL